MGKQLIKGEKIDINKINGHSNKFVIDITCKSDNENTFDIDAFICVCETNNRISKKGIIFYNNPESTEKSIWFEDGCADNIEKKKEFDIDLNSVPANISKLIIGYSIYKSKNNLDKQMLVNIKLRLINSIMQEEVFSMDIQSDIIVNNVGVIGEIYKYKEFWKFNAIEYNSTSDLISTIKILYNIEVY
ncbi:MAG: hypothetical protein A2Y22_07025 [Clostridiales bacterium GWD2_32_59]|nr:MAG: hypothetical protein A2Y22_07025 [Clostridiales bacterium GWD2_32_59]